jgi:hypothetical protein
VEATDLVEAGTEALVLVDVGTELERAIVAALWAMDDGDDALAETFLLAALQQARMRHLLADESE